MKLHNLTSTPGSRNHNPKRLGRGPGSGLGKTSGKGHKGQKARSGGGVRPGFEGGQTPLFRRLPKRGFSNALFKKDYTVINFEQLNRFEDGATVSSDTLIEKGIIKQLGKDGIKVLGNGKLETKKLSVKANAFSKSASAAIEKSGGKIEVI